MNATAVESFRTTEDTSTSQVEGSASSSTSSETPLAQKESTDVSRWKYVVIIMLLFTAALVITSTYIFLSRQEQSVFELNFRQSALSIIDTTKFHDRNTGLAYFRMADALTLDGDGMWPFVTARKFEIQAGHFRNDAFATELAFYTPIVPATLQDKWIAYSEQNQGWLEESHAFTSHTAKLYQQIYPRGDDFYARSESNHTVNYGNVSDHIFRFDGTTKIKELTDQPFVAPFWQSSPPPLDASIVNWNVLSHPTFAGLLNGLKESHLPGISGNTDLSFLYKYIYPEDDHLSLHADARVPGKAPHAVFEHPHNIILMPIRRDFVTDPPVLVGFLFGVYSWENYFEQVLSEGTDGVMCVVSNSCGDVDTYLVNGPSSYYLGKGDFHNKVYDGLKESLFYADLVALGTNVSGYCDFTLDVYPTEAYRARFNSSRPEFFTVIMGLVFLVTGVVFFVFVQYVHRRQNKVMATAERTNAIVSSLFPKNIRDRILQDAAAQASPSKRTFFFEGAARNKLKNFLEDTPRDDKSKRPDFFASKPLADLFPDTTIMFADLANFTAWSSVREPSQVFTLLETIYHAFDEIATRRRVFKVETVGDCYVAVAGLPEPRPDHALVMARFARECNTTVLRLVRELETTLGPDTGDLTMRFGLHSGPVTAGVLRGDRARFQLFGDTVNTAARMESTGESSCIHLTHETAELLETAGKAHWVRAREENVWVKGKGKMKTFWLTLSGSRAQSTASEASLSYEEAPSTTLLDWEHDEMQIEEKTQRLIDWNVDSLLRLLRLIEARRISAGEKSSRLAGSFRLNRDSEKTVLDEVQETIRLPSFDASAVQQDPEQVDLHPNVAPEVRNYVTAISVLYRKNPFHNFEHASHVVMSVIKLLSRIVAPAEIQVQSDDTDRVLLERKFASRLHDHTYGITSDPLTQFACVFSALIHDADHVGVPNSQLIAENATLANLYQGKSVAEQNSVDLCWDLLMDDRYAHFRCAIYRTETEFHRFRQLVVNSVMATDIMDKDLKGLRNARWERAFSGEEQLSAVDNTNRKATIVIEHLIQASDVSHTMQHWHVYRKWNERLFCEMLDAFKAGRAEKNPADFWYEGELGFFDFYIIPLAKKLKECGVFGVSSAEYLSYAEMNRQEWEVRGQDLVAATIDTYGARADI